MCIRDSTYIVDASTVIFMNNSTAIDADVRAEGGYEVFSMALTEKVIFMLMQVPNGIQTMSADLPGLVESSLNLGVLEERATQVDT